MMAGSFEDTVLDFDLNYLPGSSNSVTNSKLDKKRKSISMVKRRILATDSVLKQYHAAKASLQHTEKIHAAAKAECKRICIEYEIAMNKCSKLESDLHEMSTTNKELQAKCDTAENRCEAIQSYSTQLQVLVKENEIRLETIKKDRKMEKESIKNLEKKLEILEKDKNVLRKHINNILEVIFRKRKNYAETKRLLLKYKRIYNKDNSVMNLSEAEDSANELDIFDCFSPMFNEEISGHESISSLSKNTVIDKSMLNKDMLDRDLDGSQGVVSVDTGRGSSLAFSDSDKCFNSPEYFMTDSPLNTEVLSSNRHKNSVDASTSPITIHETISVATSPIIFQEESPKGVLCKKSKKKRNSINRPAITSEKTVSPMKFKRDTKTPKSVNAVAISPEVEFRSVNVDGLESYRHEMDKDKDYLTLNNNFSLFDDNSSDCEIQTILNNVRISHDVITPIPSTPGRSVSTMRSSLSLHSGTCKEAAKAREETKILRAHVVELAKDLMDLKKKIKIQLISEENQVNEPTLNNDSFEENISLLDLHEEVENSSTNISIQNENIANNQFSGDESLIPSASNDSVLNTLNALSFEEEPELATETNVETPHDIDVTNICDNTSIVDIQKGKRKKLTRLQKLKNKMLPKSKIRRANTPVLRKQRIKSKLIQIFKKKPVTAGSSITLNDKQIYDNAVKVMAEINAKQNSEIKQKSIRKRRLASTCKVSTNTDLQCLEDSNNKEVDTDVLINKNEVKQTTSSDNNTNNLLAEPITQSPEKCVTTRSRSKNSIQNINNAIVVVTRLEANPNHVAMCKDGTILPKSSDFSSVLENKKRLKRTSADKPEIQNKRILRSSAVHPSAPDDSAVIKIEPIIENNNRLNKSSTMNTSTDNIRTDEITSPIVNYDDLDLFRDDQVPNDSKQNETVPNDSKQNETVPNDCKQNETVPNDCKQNDTVPNDCKQNETTPFVQNLRESALCLMLEKYGVLRIKPFGKKLPDSVVMPRCHKIEDTIAKIVELSPCKSKQAMNRLVDDIRNWDIKLFLTALMKYLSDPVRKNEMFNKIHTPPAPPMTKAEQILLYVVTHLRGNWPGVDIVDSVLNNIEYALFQLNRTPEFGVIESMSHFYAVLCRYINAKSRLRLFILDAMYCIQFKAVPIIKQCLDVWMHILPLAHMGIAKSPLVMCLVYLLHFFKCEDRYNRVQEIRLILHQKYFYRLSEWSETKILDMFKNSIKEIRDIPIEKKMLRMALIILAKRQGARWCQNNIIKNMLLPTIENGNAPERVKLFCLSIIGPLLKPYPMDMKVHCEIVINQLIDMLGQTHSDKMQEAIFTSLIFMSRHNQNRVIQELLTWKPKEISQQMEEVLKGFVREKPVIVWKAILSKISLVR